MLHHMVHTADHTAHTRSCHALVLFRGGNYILAVLHRRSPQGPANAPGSRNAIQGKSLNIPRTNVLMSKRSSTRACRLRGTGTLRIHWGGVIYNTEKADSPASWACTYSCSNAEAGGTGPPKKLLGGGCAHADQPISTSPELNSWPDMHCAPCVDNVNQSLECAHIRGLETGKHFVGYRDHSLGLFSHPRAKCGAVGRTHAEHQRWWEGNQPHATRAAPATALSVHGGRRPFVRACATGLFLRVSCLCAEHAPRHVHVRRNCGMGALRSL